MNLIQKSAYLAVCEKCRLHAKVIFADGTESRWFASKETGLVFITLALKHEMITVEEGRAVEEQIYASNLPYSRSRLDDVLDSIFGLTMTTEELETHVRRKPSKGFGMVSSSDLFVM